MKLNDGDAGPVTGTADGRSGVGVAHAG